MKLNKYLEDLGLTWYDLPGNYVPKYAFKERLKRRIYKIKRGFCFMFSALEDGAPDYHDIWEAQAYDKRNKENNEGFCDYEFYSLDYSMALYIYPRLCEFRNEYAKCGTPSCFCFDKNGKQYDDNNDIGQKQWLETLDKMILAFKYIIKEPDWKTSEEITEIDNKISEGLELFGKYYRCLWW